MRISDWSSDVCSSDLTIPVIKLLHFIKEDKPYFRDVIDPADIDRVLCVLGRHSHQRGAAQSGAFLLFGLGAILPDNGEADIEVLGSGGLIGGKECVRPCRSRCVPTNKKQTKK